MNTKNSRTLPFVLGVLIAAFGFACLNYTNGFGIAHHAEWAAAKGLPAPTYGIFLVGGALAALGAGLVGAAIGRGSRAP